MWQQESGSVSQRLPLGSKRATSLGSGVSAVTLERPRCRFSISTYSSVSAKCLPVSRKKTGSDGSTCATMWSSTEESAPKDETIARSPGSSSFAACRSTLSPSISSNMPLSARMPSSRSLSGLCWLCRFASGEASSGIAIEGLLERRFAKPPEGRDERLVRALTLLEVGIDQAFDGVGHFLGRKAMSEDIADRCILGGVAADRNLIV